MTHNLPATFASVTTGVKNVYDIASQLIRARRQNRLINAGQLQQLNIAIQATLQADRIAAVHKLEGNAREFLIDTYKDIERYLNTPIGDMLLESLKREARFYDSCLYDYGRLTRPGDLW